MILYLHSAHATSFDREPIIGLGRLLSPRQYSRVDATAALGWTWAADNDCFQGLNERRYVAMLDAITGIPRCRFVVAPDVVADAKATDRLWDRWWQELVDRDLPIAYVAQDGVTDMDIPWAYIAALFIGGTTEFKLGRTAAALAQRAHAYDVWVHMGRVNSGRRIRYAASIGCDSVDGTKYSRFRKTWLQEGLTDVRSGRQGRLVP